LPPENWLISIKEVTNKPPLKGGAIINSYRG